MSSKWWSFCLGLSVLSDMPPFTKHDVDSTMYQYWVSIFSLRQYSLYCMALKPLHWTLLTCYFAEGPDGWCGAFAGYTSVKYNNGKRRCGCYFLCHLTSSKWSFPYIPTRLNTIAYTFQTTCGIVFPYFQIYSPNLRNSSQYCIERNDLEAQLILPLWHLNVILSVYNVWISDIYQRNVSDEARHCVNKEIDIRHKRIFPNDKSIQSKIRWTIPRITRYKHIYYLHNELIFYPLRVCVFFCDSRFFREISKRKTVGTRSIYRRYIWGDGSFASYVLCHRWRHQFKK